MRERPVVEIYDVQFFEKLVRASFSQRRKTLLNSLKGASFFNRGKQKILEALKNSGIDPKRRPETLTIGEFNTLCKQIISIKPLPPQ
jgi:16S rRNA (adenine1518-N6/adenine1519-N6)-dimethyltransferase